MFLPLSMEAQLLERVVAEGGEETPHMALPTTEVVEVGEADRLGTIFKTPHQDQRTPDQVVAVERVIHQAAQIITVRMAALASS